MENQINVNVYCNSINYDKIYDAAHIENGLYQINSHLMNHYIVPNMQFFSKMLRVNINTVVAPADRYNSEDNIEINRRGLIITFDLLNYGNPDYIFYSARYKYIFDFHSPTVRYYKGIKKTINKHYLCKCTDVLQNNYYTFETNPTNIFHFCFHAPNSEALSTKFKGAFHLKIDNLINNKCIPYRPFIVEPRNQGPKRFVTWDKMDMSFNNFFTTTETDLKIREIKPFLLEFPIQLSYPNTPTTNVHYLDDIIKPIYNTIVVDVLNTLPTINTAIDKVPAAVEYNRANKTYMCKELKTLSYNREKRRNFTKKGVRFIFGGNRRKTARKRRPRAI